MIRLEIKTSILYFTSKDFSKKETHLLTELPNFKHENSGEILISYETPACILQYHINLTLAIIPPKIIMYWIRLRPGE